MTTKQKQTLSECVTVERRYQRSIRLDADFGAADALQGFVVHESARDALKTTSALIESGQGAFTWTGPYGGGKSSMAVAMASCLLPESEAQTYARELIWDLMGDALNGEAGGWLPVLLTGRRGDPVEDLRDATADAVARAPGPALTRKSRTLDPSGRDVINRLTQEASKRELRGGVLVLIDEMGKYLEGASDRSVDIHFFQDLAEAANRSNGRLIVVGILHQAFERYAERLGTKTQDDWAKIQGRFVDIPIVTAIDEVIDLLGRAIQFEKVDPGHRKTARHVAEMISARRPGTPADLADRLVACWPLHPATTTLIGPVTRRRFGQNERSLFGFLSSAEPSGFREFLARTEVGSKSTFEPADLWDYLRTNYEPAIQASPDGHRWALAVDAIERSLAAQSALHERLAKTVATIDLFRNGSGIAATPEILETCGGEASRSEIHSALNDLCQRSALVFRRHLNAYAIYAGSDFDIDGEVQARLGSDAALDIAALNKLADLRPVLAKAHYYRTGTPRWYATSLIEIGPSGLPSSQLAVPNGAAGRFVLALPHPDIGLDEARELVGTATNSELDLPVAVGLPPNGDVLTTLGRELTAVQEVRASSPELEGDATARREIDGRIRHLTALLEEALREAFARADWYVSGVRVADSQTSMSRLASDLADTTFHAAPTIHSELANRQKPSSNTNSAIRILLSAIADNPDQARFGISGYPQEIGIAETVLVATGIFAEDGEAWAFRSPDSSSDGDGGFGNLWAFTDTLLSSSAMLTVAELYDHWSRPPFGLRRGVMPVLAVAYLMTRKAQTAVYIEGMFQPVITDLVMDRLLQDPRDIAFRQVAVSKADRTALKTFADAAENLLGWRPLVEPLPIAQALVEFSFKLPGWSRHARGALSEEAIKVRHALLHADDPHELFGQTLPSAVGENQASAAQKVVAALQELRAAYPAMLEGLKTKMLAALKHRGDDLEPLRARAGAIKRGAGDDLKLSGFVTHLTTFEGTLSEIEAICGLVTGQPVSTWRDLEPGRAAVQLSDFAYRFRRIELFGESGDAPTQTAVMMMAGVGDAERSVVRRAQVSVAVQKSLQPLVSELKAHLRKEKLDQDRLLAVLADVAHDLLEDDGEQDVTVTIIDDNFESNIT